jgi:nitrogen fixation protein NifB
MMKETRHHPCFEHQARQTHARIHLPVAPRCNIQCNFCNRKYSCVNESRPGVTDGVLRPKQALERLDAMLKAGVPLSVVGIAGPGDAFANVDETLETLQLIHNQYPELLLCLSTNGLALLPWIKPIAEIGVSHLTITVNALDAKTATKIYRWVRIDGKILRGIEAGEALVKAQALALQDAVRYGFTIKINTVVIPGVNHDQVVDIASWAASIGADLHNCIPMIPVSSTPFGNIPTPDDETMQTLRDTASKHLPQMTHCSRCRADACGFLGQEKHS